VRPEPATNLCAQVPTASGLTAFAHYSRSASFVGFGLIAADPLDIPERFRRLAQNGFRQRRLGDRVNVSLEMLKIARARQNDVHTGLVTTESTGGFRD
jgi:hypothetical protein